MSPILQWLCERLQMHFVRDSPCLNAHDQCICMVRIYRELLSVADSGPFTILNKQLWRRRKIAEYEVFNIITREVSNRRDLFSDSVVVDSLAIRPYVPAKRPFTDLDIVFPSHVPFDKILQIAGHLSAQGRIIRMPEPNKSLHIKYPTLRMREIDLTSEFSIHLQSGGVWYKNKTFELDDVFFDSKRWVSVPSAADIASVLPVPKIEELLLLKLDKFLGFDKIDVLSILTFPNVDFPYIIERAQTVGKADAIVANLEQIRTNYVHIKNQWSVENLLSMSDEVEHQMKVNIMTFWELLNANSDI